VSNFQMPVSLYMSAPVQYVKPDDSIGVAYRRMLELRVSSLAVCDVPSRLVGVISRSDLLRIGQRQAGSHGKAALLTLPEKAVSRRMTREVLTVAPGDSLSEAARIMVEGRVHRVFVVDEGALTGVLSTRDLMLAIRDKRVNQPIAQWMSSPLFTVRCEEPLSLATERLGKARVSGLVVLEGDWPVGVFTESEALAARDAPRDLPIEECMSAAMLTLPVDTTLHRAAAQAAALGVRRVIAVQGRDIRGILSGLDFARAVM